MYILLCFARRQIKVTLEGKWTIYLFTACTFFFGVCVCAKTHKVYFREKWTINSPHVHTKNSMGTSLIHSALVGSMVCSCLAVTCHLNFWQKDRALLTVTEVTRGWNGYRNKSAQKADPGCLRVQDLCESRCGRPGLPVTDHPYGLCGRKATLNLNSDTQRSGAVCTVSVDVMQHWTQTLRAPELSGSRSGRPGLPVPNIPYGLCGRKATLNLNSDTQSSGAVWKSRWPSWAPRP